MNAIVSSTSCLLSFCLLSEAKPRQIQFLILGLREFPYVWLRGIRGSILRFSQLAETGMDARLFPMNASPPPTPLQVPFANRMLGGILEIPADARNIIVFAHAHSGSNLSPRNRLVARELFHHGFAVLLPDLTESAEADTDARPLHERESVFLTATRLIAVIDWLGRNPATSGLRIGLFGVGSGAAAVMIAAALRPDEVQAVISSGGRPDLADDLLAEVQAPTLMLVGSMDKVFIDHNRNAGARMRCRPMLELIHGANHLFAEPGKLEQVASMSSLWFKTALNRCA